MNKKIILIIIVAVIIVSGGAFYGGMKYGQGQTSPGMGSFEQRQQFIQRMGGEDAVGRMRGQEGLGLLNGEVIAKDQESVTIKLLDGGSKIVFFSDSTMILKSTEGSIDDIEIGKQISVGGSQNSDGSYTASNIRLAEEFRNITE